MSEEEALSIIGSKPDKRNTLENGEYNLVWSYYGGCIMDFINPFSLNLKFLTLTFNSNRILIDIRPPPGSKI